MNEAELVLMILECYLKYGPTISLRNLCVKTQNSEKKIKYILSILEKRDYLTKVKDTNEYKLTKKIAMLI